MRVGVDLDGVCFDFGKSLARYLDDHHAGRYQHGNGKTSTWDFYTEWGMDLNEFLKACHDGVDLGYVFRGPARYGAPRAIRKLHKLGHEIIIITDRQFGSDPKNSQRATIEWLAEHKIPYDQLHFSADKTIVPTDMFVEDKLENYDALDAAGSEVWLINRPWNRVPGGDERRRCGSITEFASIVRDVSALCSV